MYSQIYLKSELMHDIQLAHIYPDSKTFVDKKLKCPESEIIANYKALKDNNNGQVPPKSDLVKFIDDYLEDGDELEEWTPTDFVENPSIVNRIKDQNYKEWVCRLNYLWKTLTRKVKDDVKMHPERYSLLWVPNGFVIPGGRFRELYYWDTYWIINGLLLSDMKTTARGVIDNIVSLVKQFGFMPNGARIYYLNRSQPPLLILMVLSYYRATNDFDYIKSIIDDLECEFQFWMKNRMVTFEKDGKSYTMGRYYVPTDGPRPESYKEDYELAEMYDTQEKKNDLYSRIKATAESGWDFSSRWYIPTSCSNPGDLSDIQTPNIVPVDLNCFLHVNALALSTWFGCLGKQNKADEYRSISETFLNNIQDVMWREDKGAWFDWDLINNRSRDNFYVSNIVPLWTGSYNMQQKKMIAHAVLEYLKNEHIIEPDYRIKYSGTPTSMRASSQQWDFPNGWPPLQAFIIQGLDWTKQKRAQEVASKLAEVWLRSNYKGYIEKTIMFEKYDVLRPGETGGGGEYEPQIGFGWTNGLVLELLNRWGSSIISDEKRFPSVEQESSTVRENILMNFLNRFTCWK